MHIFHKISYAACSIALAATAAHSQHLTSKARDYTALIDAENSKSTLCRTYEGKVVIPASFAEIIKTLLESKARGEYETANQYDTRKTDEASRIPTTPLIVSVPIDAEFVQYEADAASFIVKSGAFNTRSFSDETQADIAATAALFASSVHKRGVSRTSVGISSSKKPISTGTAKTIFGTDIRVSTVERHTSGLTLAGDKLFGFANNDQSMIAVLTAEPGVAPTFKAKLRVAIVLEPQAPYVIRGAMNGAPATTTRPTQYIEKTTLLVGRARCGLILNEQSRVLASIDAGT